MVVGVVETHGRADTAALIGDLEQVPRRRIEYRGVVLEEMDLDAILARRPQVALVDELAHTNAPGSRNAKRYQDVEELLQAGIHVITTLNIQHLESLYDIVESCTGVKVKERVPDYVLGQADQIVNVDLSAEDLQERLRGGKVYPRERVESALANFFTGENLTRLRELALEEIRHLLDRRRQAQSGGRPGGVGPRHGLPQLAQPQRRTCCCARGRGWPTACTPPGTRSTSRRRARTCRASMRRRSGGSPTRWPWPTSSAPCR